MINPEMNSNHSNNLKGLEMSETQSTTEKLLEMISEYTEVTKVDSNYMKGTEIAVECNKVLKSLSLPTIKTQMIYNYMNNGLIPSETLKDGKTYVRREDAMKWIVKYVSRKKSRRN